MSEQMCPICAEAVKREALKCKFCHSWIGKGKTSLKSPEVQSKLTAFFFIFFGFGIILFSEKYFKDIIDKVDQVGKGFNDETSGLTISIIKFEKSDNEYVIHGKLENNSQIKWNGISLEAYLYDQDKYVDMAEEYVSGKVLFDKPRHFKIQFGCADSCKNLPEFDRHEIKIINAYK